MPPSRNILIPPTLSMSSPKPVDTPHARRLSNSASSGRPVSGRNIMLARTRQVAALAQRVIGPHVQWIEPRVNSAGLAPTAILATREPQAFQPLLVARWWDQ